VKIVKYNDPEELSDYMWQLIRIYTDKINAQKYALLNYITVNLQLHITCICKWNDLKKSGSPKFRVELLNLSSFMIPPRVSARFAASCPSQRASVIISILVVLNCIISETDTALLINTYKIQLRKYWFYSWSEFLLSLVWLLFMMDILKSQ
jgi:hypothetical protein